MRILLVDDDAGVVQALLSVLKTLPGHVVRAATNGEEALAEAAALDGLDLLITDVVMDPMDGFTLRDQMMTLYPDVRTILISGYDLSDYPEQTAHFQLLAKPVDADTLRTAVARELPSAPASEDPAPEGAAAAAPAPAPATPEVTPLSEAPAALPPDPAPAPAPPEATPATPAPEPEPAPVAEIPPPAEPSVPTPPAPTPAVTAPKAVPAAIPVNPPAAPAAIPAPKPVSAPAVPPAAVPVSRTSETPVARPTVVVKAVPAPSGVPVARAQPTVSSPSVPVPSAQPVARVHPSATAAPKVQPSVTVKAIAIPRPSGVTPSPVAAQPSGSTPGLPTVRMAATVKVRPVPPPSAPGATAVPASGVRPPSAVSAPPGVPRASAAPGIPRATANPGVRTTSVPTPAPRSGAVQTKALTPAPVPRAAVSPTIVAAAVPATQIAPPPTAPPPAAGSGEDLSGTMLGAYQILRKTGEGRWGGTYAGMQMSINRPVSLEILDKAKANDPALQNRFVADARAKAAVQHPSILAVYEAGEADGRFFYAYEHVDGQSLADLKADGGRLDELMALKVLRVAADGYGYLNVHHTPHLPPDASNLYIGADGQPRLGNIATQIADEQIAPPQEIQGLGRVMLGVLPAIQSLTPGLREMLKRMVQQGPQSLTSWGNVLQGIKAIEPKIVPTDAAKISAHDRAAIAAVELARKQQKRSLYYNLGSLISLAVLIVVAVWFFLFKNKERIHDEQIHIPAGQFLFANGEGKTLPDFWIDKYEVTYGQYARFVQFLEGHPTSEYDHPQQPRSKTAMMHKPPHWAIFFGQAEIGGKAHSTPIDLSCPVMEVDFWDAYAYAKWKGRELPTEEEWEKAARGTKGFIYPWGEEVDPKRVNSNADFNANDPSAEGKVDGFNFWNPVDKVKSDKSPFGVIGMAGNVREWIGTWDPAKKRPIVKGGSFMSSDVRLDQRTDLDPSAVSEAIGFRTITRTPPTAK